MLAIIVVFAVSVALISLLVVVASRLMGRVLGQTMHDQLKAAEHIVRTHQAPPAWAARLAPAGRAGPRAEDRARGAILRRLDRLISSLKTAPVFQDDEARRILLGELGRTRDMWAAGSLEGIIGGRGAGQGEARSEEQPPG